MARHADRAEPLVWKAIILSSHAGAVGGLGALGKVKEARRLLEQAEAIDPEALDGSVYTSLGSLYYQVPGWPVGFGSDEQAEKYLKKALSVNPDGIDPNYFYGDYLLEQKRYREAVGYLEKALQAPDRPQRAVADEGRRNEARNKLAEARKHL
jgi:Tfp pilus assembly protein PilF